MKAGALALQGDFREHAAMFAECGAAPILVRTPEDLAEVACLAIPGGESTTFLKFLEQQNFFGKLGDFVKTKPALGTCAGAILLAKEVEGPSQASLGALDIRIRRNAYGRQLESSIRQAETKLAGGPMEMVFIRAPRIERVGKEVEVLASAGGDPVLVRQGKIMAATFHPELSDDSRVHQAFLQMVK